VAKVCAPTLRCIEPKRARRREAKAKGDARGRRIVSRKGHGAPLSTHKGGVGVGQIGEQRWNGLGDD
jgi:hypothetical protein